MTSNALNCGFAIKFLNIMNIIKICPVVKFSHFPNHVSELNEGTRYLTGSRSNIL